MKRMIGGLIIAVIFVSVSACGVGQHPNRQGFTNNVNNSADAHAKIMGRTPDYVYYSNEHVIRGGTSAAGGIDLEGFFSYQGISQLLHNQNAPKVQVVVTIERTNETSCRSLLMISVDKTIYGPIQSTQCTHTSGSMNITFSDGSDVHLTGYSMNGYGSTITIQDYSKPRVFINSVFFNLWTPQTNS